MKEKIDFSKINFNEFENTYNQIIKFTDKEIESTISDLIAYENQKKGVDLETLIIKFLNHKSTKVRLKVTKYLENSSDISTLRKIKEVIGFESDESVKKEAIIIFGNWVSKYVIKKNKNKELNTLIDFGLSFIESSQLEEEENLMIQSLSFSNDEKIENLIMEKYSSTKEEDINCSILSMGNSGDTKWIPLIEEVLENDNYKIRSNSCISLSLIGDEEHIDQIKELLEDEELETQKSALIGISNIGGEYAKSILEKLKFSTEPEIVELSKVKLEEIRLEEELESSITPEKMSEGFMDQSNKKPTKEFDEYNAAEIEGWGSLNSDGTSFLAPDAIDDDIDDPIKSLADYEKPIDQPNIDD